MSETQTAQAAKGACLCGAVTIAAKNASTHVGSCHCGMCRKWTGGPLMTIDCGSDVQFDGEDHIGRYVSSDWAERGFCKQCGSGLFYHFKAQNLYIMPVGLFDDLDNLAFDHQIYIDAKPDYYCFANDTKNMTEAEVIEQFMGSSQE